MMLVCLNILSVHCVHSRHPFANGELIVKMGLVDKRKVTFISLVALVKVVMTRMQCRGCLQDEDSLS
jgi:hypothetical protein